MMNGAAISHAPNLLNVILNAIQASRPGAVVRVREQIDQQDAVIDVLDQGSGIPAEHLPHIFSPFFTTREKGTGLGLAIASRIMMTHRGSLEIHETSAHGTCLRIRLPIGRSGRQIRARKAEPRG